MRHNYTGRDIPAGYDEDDLAEDNYGAGYGDYPDQYDDEPPQAPQTESAPEPEAEAKHSEPLKYAGTFTGEYDDDYRAAVLEQIRLAKIRRARADKRAKDKLHAEIVLITVAVLLLVLISFVIIHIGKRKRQAQDFVIDEPPTTSVTEELKDLPEPIEKKTEPPPVVGTTPFAGEAAGHDLVQKDGVTYIDGILIVNKTFPLPKSYKPGPSQEAEDAFYAMAGAAWADGIGIWQNSGYRSYEEQEELFGMYAADGGLAEADTYSARPGHSEHQTGLAYDVNTANFGFVGTPEAYWIEQHCAEYGFIVRFPQGKEKVTGYDYEPWHIRYVGVELAQKLMSTGQCLEEYLNITSKNENSPDNEEFLKAYSQYTEKPADSSSEAPAENQWQGDGYTDYGYYDYGY